MTRPALTDQHLRRKSAEYRRDVLRAIYHAGAGHTGGSLSCIDILNVLYNRVMNISPVNWRDPLRDRYVQSKGHSVEALYVVLADKGFYPFESLEKLCRGGSYFVGHPTRKIPGIEMNTGALGHGLPVSVGMAIAGKLDAASYRVFTLLGDGELAEGSNWEAAMCAAHYKLDNLTAIIDCNTLQITGATRDVCCNEPLDEKFTSFGWEVLCIDGHDVAELTTALSRPAASGKPTCIIARTVKGRGVSFMEGVVKWHHGVPSADEFAVAMAELEGALK
ncbi:transketolase [Botrimarina mediterranea]|uniref:Ferredoxin fas2 n=1 Tax=Botrimarina mediterranea TaxID=2528022 RepID=A0A518K9G4_9BACT|nr:transketolase [Botrimarina mediterranea]QDV74438.1 Ferredoxin fas2 [Botrimarina mediterranea]QDV79034.1 Ferredoxin fas2 [Planctomycetes bacterium K2D]